MPYGTSKRTTMIIITVLSGAFIAILNQTLLAPALPSIMADLGITAADGQWLTTAFMMVNGIMIPITAYLMAKFTTRQLFLGSMALFTIGTIIAAVSGTFTMLLAGRIFQAMGAGILMPLQQNIILLSFPVAKRGSAMGMVGLVMIVAPAIGPSLAGWMVDSFNWHALFVLIAPIAVIDMIVAFFVLKNMGETSNPTLDVPSVILSTLGFGGLLYGFSIASSVGWASMITIGTLVIGIVALAFFIRRQFHLDTPLLELRVFKYRIFAYATILGMIVNASLLIGGIITPIYLQTVRGFSALTSGLVMLPGAVIMGIMSPITGKILDKFGPRQMSLIGLFTLTASGGCLAFLSETTSLTYITIVYTIRMFGMSMLMMPLTTWGLNALADHLLPHGTAVNNTFRQVAGSIGTAVLVTIMTAATSSKIPEMGEKLATIHGTNVAFACVALLCLISLIMAYFVVHDREKCKKWC